MHPETYVMGLFILIHSTEKSKGTRNEKKAVAAFKGDFWDVPDWFDGIRNASGLEEPKGIDIVVQAKDIARPIYIQIKSCEGKAGAFRKEQEKGVRRKDIAVIVIKDGYSPREIRKLIVDAAWGERRRILKEISARHGATFIAA